MENNKDKRNKICINCNEKFYDDSKRLSRNSCSKKCHYEKMAKTRKEKGSYVVTEERIQKMLATMNKLRSEGGIKQPTQEQKEKSSILLKYLWESGYMQQKIYEASMKKHNVSHYMKTNEQRSRASKQRKGKKASKETLKKMSEVSKNNNVRFSRCRGGFRSDLNLYFRSSWEANFARLLNHLHISWGYENKTYSLEDGCYSYTPDFILKNGVHIELKGWFTEKSKKKINLFRKEYPNVKLIIIDRKTYKKIYSKYKDLIENWECIST
jgi:hypothetical protein